MDSEIIQKDLPDGWVWANLKEVSLPVANINKNAENSSDVFKYIDIEAIDHYGRGNSMSSINNISKTKKSRIPGTLIIKGF
jgi:hypothetical protein